MSESMEKNIIAHLVKAKDDAEREAILVAYRKAVAFEEVSPYKDEIARLKCPEAPASEDYSESETWDAFEAGYMQGHNDTVESCVRDSKEAAQDYFAENKPRALLARAPRAEADVRDMPIAAVKAELAARGINTAPLLDLVEQKLAELNAECAHEWEDIGDIFEGCRKCADTRVKAEHPNSARINAQLAAARAPRAESVVTAYDEATNDGWISHDAPRAESEPLANDAPVESWSLRVALKAKEAAEAERDQWKDRAMEAQAQLTSAREENEALRAALKEEHEDQIKETGDWGLHLKTSRDCPVCALLRAKGETK